MVEKIVLMIIFLMMLESALGTLHRVGDKQGWNPNVNYTEWSSQQRFYVGDWLLFNFDKHYFNVLEVNETGYENCNEQGFILNITRGGRDVVELTEARPYYFLSSGGYCYHGMKLALNVEIHQAPALAPATDKHNSSPPKDASATHFLLFILISIVGQAYLCFVF